MKPKTILSIFVIIAVFTTLVLVGCETTTVKPIDNGNSEKPNNHQDNTPTEFSTDAKNFGDLTQEELDSWEGMIKFNSKEELAQFLDISASQSSNYYAQTRGGGIIIETAMDMDIADAVAPKVMPTEVGESFSGAANGDEGYATDVSTTNVQVEGVDEADFVKNDNKYIYILTGDVLAIVDAYPAEDAELLSETEITGSAREMFVNGDKLVLFTEVSEPVYTIAEYDYVPRPRHTTRMHMLVYDVSDREDPALKHDISVTGNYFDSRMIGDYVYFITQEYVNRYYDGLIMPSVREGDMLKISPDVYYFPNPDSSYNFNTVASLDLSSDDAEMHAKTFMLGYSNTLYVSQDNIYIAHKKQYNYWNYNQNMEERFYEVVVPLFEEAVQDDINYIRNSNLPEDEKWDEISVILEKMYNTMGERKKELLVDEIEDAIDDYEARMASEREKTVIHRIAIDDGELKYKARGEVPGDLLNQWSMDEWDNHFRVATTTNIWTRKTGSEQYNNVFVMDMDMDVVGSLEDIAPDERIYSTRFMGRRLYMVTFKRIDPLFVIDVSNHKQPKILGELKIPGYSDYLHPYDENHIIGIGKETEGNEWGGVSIGGVKISLFDVSDVSKPKQVDKLEIGSQGSDSDILYDHKAFLFIKDRDLVVIPVREVKGSRYYDNTLRFYRRKVWQGAYVLRITPEEGIQRVAKISHFEGDAEDFGYWYTGPYNVRRSLYMDDILYTISSKLVLATSLDDLYEDISVVELPYEVNNDRWPKYYID